MPKTLHPATSEGAGAEGTEAHCVSEANATCSNRGACGEAAGVMHLTR